LSATIFGTTQINLFVSTVNEPDHTHSLSPTRFVQVSSTPIAFPTPTPNHAHLATSTDFLFACQQLGCPLTPLPTIHPPRMYSHLYFGNIFLAPI